MLKVLLQRMQIDYVLSAFFSEIYLFYQKSYDTFQN